MTMHAWAAQSGRGPLRGMGSYYPTQMEWPVSGLGAYGLGQPPGSALDAGMKALLDILAGSGVTTAVKPLGTFTGWGKRTGELNYAEQPTPAFDYAVFGLSPGALELARQLGPVEPGWVGILYDKPKDELGIRADFVDTPYEYFETEVLYDQADKQTPPKAWFLGWGRLRDRSSPGYGTNPPGSGAPGAVMVMPIQQPPGVRRTAPTGLLVPALNAQYGIVVPGQTTPGGGGGGTPTPGGGGGQPGGGGSGGSGTPGGGGGAVVKASALPAWAPLAGLGIVMFGAGVMLTMGLGGRSSGGRRRRSSRRRG